MTEPKCKEVEITVATGGKVQLVHFRLSNDFAFSYNEKYTIPASWSHEQFEEWKQRKTDEIKAKVDDLAQVEQDALLDSSDWYK